MRLVGEAVISVDLDAAASSDVCNVILVLLTLAGSDVCGTILAVLTL